METEQLTPAQYYVYKRKKWVDIYIFHSKIDKGKPVYQFFNLAGNEQILTEEKVTNHIVCLVDELPSATLPLTKGKVYIYINQQQLPQIIKFVGYQTNRTRFQDLTTKGYFNLDSEEHIFLKQT